MRLLSNAFIFTQVISILLFSFSKIDNLFAQGTITNDSNIIYRDNLFNALKTEDMLLTIVVLDREHKKPKKNIDLEMYIGDSHRKNYTTDSNGEIKVNLQEIITSIDNYSFVFIPKVSANNCTVNVKRSLIENNISKFKNIKEEEKSTFLKQKTILKRQEIEKKHPKWPRKAIDAILASKVFIGMTKEQATMSWGKPTDINRTTTKSGTREQWVYALDCYLYFEGNKLVAIQN